jgi:hypothetical protein
LLGAAPQRLVANRSQLEYGVDPVIVASENYLQKTSPGAPACRATSLNHDGCKGFWDNRAAVRHR